MVVAGQGFSDGLALLGVGQSGQGRAEEENLEDGEEDEEFQDDQPDERTAPSLILEAIPVKMPNFFQHCGPPFPVLGKYSNSFSDIFIILPIVHEN
jgi:hypothetical protein